jgi:hypothetical protein
MRFEAIKTPEQVKFSYSTARPLGGVMLPIVMSDEPRVTASAGNSLPFSS